MGCKCPKKKKKPISIDISFEKSKDSAEEYEKYYFFNNISTEIKIDLGGNPDIRRNKDATLQIEKKKLDELVFSPESKQILYEHKDKFM